jgi:anthranilate phosphoribosyltransferase
MILDAISKLIKEQNLTESEMKTTIQEIMEGKTTPAQIASFLTALRMKGETVEEITGAVRAMRQKLISPPPKASRRTTLITVDTCGTGGDHANTFNISTVAALAVAGAGAFVAKHGNRSVSSRCGSADLLERLGVRIEIPPHKVEECLYTVGIVFLFAPAFHPAMKHSIGPRKEMGIRTIFNLLGPLTNPLHARHQLIGVYEASLTEIFARVLKRLGSKRAMVVCGSDGLDEITITGSTKISELKNGKVRTYTIRPQDFGIKKGILDDIRGGSPEDNARITLSILKGEKGPRRDITLLNTAAALVVSSRAKNFPEGIALAQNSLDHGKALHKLEKLIEFTHACIP